jgi:hypothetical protein
MLDARAFSILGFGHRLLSDAPAFYSFSRPLLIGNSNGVTNVTPVLRRCRKSPTTARKRWLQATLPYVIGVQWLQLTFSLKGEDAARRAYLRLGAEQKDLIKVGFQIVFERRYQAKPGYAYHRPEMFVGVAKKASEFPVKILANMRVATYRRLIDEGKEPV